MRSVDLAGDTDGDGISEIVIGVMSCHGAVVYSPGSRSVTRVLQLSTRDAHSIDFGGHGDVNGDGVSDVSLCSGGWSVSEGKVFCGIDGGVLHTYSARALAIVGDIDRDGCREVLVARAVESLEPAGTVDIPVGHWDAQGNKSATSYMHIPEDHIRRSAFLYISTVHAVDPITTGQIELHSGRTGEVLRVSERIDEYIRHPCRVGDAGDVDADAVHDWWVLAGGRVAIYSGANGSLSFSIGPVADCEPLSVAAGQDVNGDGCADVVVGHSWIRGEGVGPRAVRVYSGASGKLLWSYVAATTRPSEEFADEVAFAGDVDGDRCSDVLVTYRDTFGRSGVLLLSGRNGKLIRDFGEPDNGCLPRFDVLGGLDYDVDSIPDLFFVVLDNEGWCSRANSIEVRSGRTGAWIDTIR